MLVVGDLSLVKVHVHTNDPGKALQYGLQLGELSDFNIENMVEQHRQKQAPEGAVRSAAQRTTAWFPWPRVQALRASSRIWA